MFDLKFLSIRDLLPVVKVEFAQGLVPLSVIVTGDKMNEASQVLINDVECPEFIVASPTRLIAQVPNSERNSTLRKIAVLAESPSVNRSSLLKFELGPSLKTISGLERLVQLFVKLLLQTPGSDKFDTTQGGGLLAAVGKNISKNDNKSVQAMVVSAISRTRDQIVAMQAKNNRIPADERLLTAKTEAVGFDPNTTTVSASVSLTAVSGRQAVTNISF
jgi:hypothetical protein